MSYLENISIGCIGVGNMGSAIISCLSKKIKRENIICYDIDKARLDSLKSGLGIRTVDSISELADAGNVLIIAVKPDIVRTVLQEIKKKIAKKVIISIAAGITTKDIKEILESNEIVRVMPNTPALVGEGMSVISTADGTSDRSLKIAEEIFSYIGRTIVLSEKLMDAVTAVSGCGPAYVFTLIQAMIDGAVKLGLPRDKAVILAAQTVLGAARMVLEGKDDPITLRGKVTSPGGSTIEAVHVLERSGFSGIIMDAVEAAKIKSEKLGKL